MPNVFKSLFGESANAYVFRPAEELKIDDEKPVEPQSQPGASQDEDEIVPEPETDEETDEEHTEDAPPEPTPETDPIFFARIQAEAILADARKEAESYKEQAREELDAELDEARRAAREDGYSRGYAEGMAQAMQEGKEECNRLAMEQIKGIETFLEHAAQARDNMLDDAREELKDLAIAIAEKVIHVSLKNSSDIILRMVDSATDTHKRCEWAHIYVSDCDVGGKAYTVPELTAALSHIADRVRVIPMPDEESGTCIVELPDVIYDASVSTQLDNIKEVLDGVVLERD
ncbi:MAG: F0F1 ATP synthase subunit delta [Oscillospiraceae bacterium]|nr:F0F1 ATP synthase subunit delta [Oscillospiraceae bacterium]